MSRIWRRRSSCVLKQWPWLEEKAFAGRPWFTQEAKDKRVHCRYIINWSSLICILHCLCHLHLFTRTAYYLYCLLFSDCQGSASKHSSTISRTQFTCSYLSDSVKRPRENEVITATPCKRIRWSICFLLFRVFFSEKVNPHTIIEDRLCKW